jgi:hypothetical protein
MNDRQPLLPGEGGGQPGGREEGSEGQGTGDEAEGDEGGGRKEAKAVREKGRREGCPVVSG